MIGCSQLTLLIKTTTLFIHIALYEAFGNVVVRLAVVCVFLGMDWRKNIGAYGILNYGLLLSVF